MRAAENLGRFTVRTAYIGTATAGSVLTAANLNKAPGGWIGDVNTTSVQTGISTVTDLTSLTVTVTVGTSRRVKITGFVPGRQQTSGGLVKINIQEGATVLTSAYLTAGVAVFSIFTAQVVLTPSSGSHTYKLTAETSAGTFDTSPSAANPVSIVVEDLGPA